MTTPSPSASSVPLHVRSQDPPRSIKGDRTRILLTSVFGPYAQDDQFGSRRINPMELFHNQVTRVDACATE